jgi:hypothetical protein
LLNKDELTGTNLSKLVEPNDINKFVELFRWAQQQLDAHIESTCGAGGDVLTTFTCKYKPFKCQMAYKSLSYGEQNNGLIDIDISIDKNFCLFFMS